MCYAAYIVLLALLFNACLGMGYALCARDRLRVDGPFASPAFLLVLIFTGIVMMPLTLYFYWAHTAWSWLYVVDPADVPALAVVPMVVLHVGLLVGGWYGGARLLRSDKRHAAMYVAAGGVAVFLVLVVLLRSRLASYGSYGQFQEGTSASLLDVKLGYALIALGVAFTVSVAYVALELSRDSRRVRAR